MGILRELLDRREAFVGFAFEGAARGCYCLFTLVPGTLEPEWEVRFWPAFLEDGELIEEFNVGPENSTYADNQAFLKSLDVRVVPDGTAAIVANRLFNYELNATVDVSVGVHGRYADAASLRENLAEVLREQHVSARKWALRSNDRVGDSLSAVVQALSDVGMCLMVVPSRGPAPGADPLEPWDEFSPHGSAPAG